jgi:hypothetical protein
LQMQLAHAATDDADLEFSLVCQSIILTAGRRSAAASQAEVRLTSKTRFYSESVTSVTSCGHRKRNGG